MAKIQWIYFYRSEELKHMCYDLFERDKDDPQSISVLDKKSGLTKEIRTFKNGQKEYEGYHKNGKAIGKWKGWYKDGSKFWETEYDENGKHTGKYVVWHENGKVAVEGQFKDGKEFGKWTCYEEDETIAWQTLSYQDGFGRHFKTKHKLKVIKTDNSGNDHCYRDSRDLIRIFKGNSFYVSVREKDPDKFYYIAAELRQKHVTSIDIDLFNYPRSVITYNYPLMKWHLQHIKGMPLKMLSFHSCANMTKSSMYCIKDMPLEVLNLSYSSNLEDDGLVYLGNMPLKVLDLNNCSKITSNGLVHLRNQRNLKTLNLKYCDKLPDNYKLKFNKPILIRFLLRDNFRRLKPEQFKKESEVHLQKLLNGGS